MPAITLAPPLSCEYCERDAELLHQTADISITSVCSDCLDWRFEQCAECDGYVRTVTAVEGGDLACGACLSTNFNLCGAIGCETYIRTGPELCADCAELEEDEDDSGCGCPACIRLRSPYIHSYEYRPPPVFHGDGPVYLGLELEVEAYDLADSADIACQGLDRLGYLKEDSSIGYGFELVTHPMSLRYALDSFPWRLLKDLEQSGCDPGNNGLHVHISRDGFTGPAHIYSWIVFIYRNAVHVARLARRESEHWASFCPDVRRHAKDHAKGVKGGRYRAVNSSNEHTLELRVFASTLNEQEVKAALAFAAASVDYARTLTVHDLLGGGWDWSAFTTWVANRPEYGDLHRELLHLREDAGCAC